jgi:molybdenum cofactor sulfurtransferase
MEQKTAPSTVAGSLPHVIAPSPGDLLLATEAFTRSFPAYARTATLDVMRSVECARLDRSGQAYLDYTGAGQYADAQLRAHLQVLRRSVFGNPHSGSAASLAATSWVERVRVTVLRFFGASPEEYLVAFTPNATGALKLAGEAYPFRTGGRYLISTDNHNSVNGIREFARAQGAATVYVPLVPETLRLDRAFLSAELERGCPEGGGLFAYPAQSNFTGVQHPLELIEEAHATGWDVLLDAAAYVPTNRLDLTRWKPDLVAVSFYKMFGYPTGVGCLLVRRPVFERLRRPWFSGGTVRIASVQADAHYLKQDATGFEDGTVNFLSLPAVAAGLEGMERAGMDVIRERVRCLAGWILERMQALRHRNGTPLVRVHGPGTMESRGACIAFSVTDPHGTSVDIDRIEALANAAKISLRTGCFCNPGAGEAAFGVGPAEIADYFSNGDGIDFDELRTRMRREHGREVGAVRVSLGMASNFADAYRFVSLLMTFVDRTAAEIDALANGGA